MLFLKLFKKNLSYFYHYNKLSHLTKDENYVYILNIIPQIGDICIHFSYLEAFKKKINKKICVIAINKHRDVFNAFSYCYDKILYIDDKFAFKIIGLYDERFYWNLLYDRQKNNQLINPYYFNYVNFCLRDNYFDGSILDFTRDFIYKVDSNSKMNFPIVKNDKLLPYNDVMKIVFAPYANSSFYDLKFFNGFVERLKRKHSNWILYTNVFADEAPLPMTKELRISKEELFNMSKENCVIIGTRSGILDFIISAAKLIIAISFRDEFTKMYSIKNWNMNAEELIITEEDNYNQNYDWIEERIKNKYGN